MNHSHKGMWTSIMFLDDAYSFEAQSSGCKISYRYTAPKGGNILFDNALLLLICQSLSAFSAVFGIY